MQDLKLDMNLVENLWRTMETILDLCNPNFLDKPKTLVVDLWLTRSIDWSTLEYLEYLRTFESMS